MDAGMSGQLCHSASVTGHRSTHGGRADLAQTWFSSFWTGFRLGTGGRSTKCDRICLRSGRRFLPLAVIAEAEGELTAVGVGPIVQRSVALSGRELLRCSRAGGKWWLCRWLPGCSVGVLGRVLVLTGADGGCNGG
jgi:hypothetical protein